MDDATRNKLERMTKEAKEQRFQELTTKLGITNPELLENGEPPKTTLSLEDVEERQWLKNNLGY